jgi:hypothetical protein
MHFPKVKSELRATRSPFYVSSLGKKRHVIIIIRTKTKNHERHFSNKSKKCQNLNGFLSFFIDNPHSAINSHHTVRHGNFHNFHFSSSPLFAIQSMESEKLTIFLSGLLLWAPSIFTLFHRLRYIKLDFLQFNLMANTLY